jgi:chemotaxis protein CheC
VAQVLVVDDSRIARKVIRQALEREGHGVLEAADGPEALESALEHRPDCITTDVLMPGMDGRTLIEELDGGGVEAPVIVITADIQTSTREECLRRGAVAVLDKPLKARELLEVVARVVVGAPARPVRQLEPAQLDQLAELINIGVGRAASALSELVENPVDLSVPEVRVVAAGDLPAALRALGPEAVSSVHMGFRGSLAGSAFLVFPQPSALKLVELMTAEEVQATDLDGILAGTLTEVGNILINCVVGTISNLLARPLRYAPPVYEEEPIMSLLSAPSEEEPLIVLARTTFRIRDMEVAGSLLLLFELESFDSLLAAMARGFEAGQ